MGRGAEDETCGWHHCVNGHEFEPTLETVKDREDKHAAWGCKEFDLATERQQSVPVLLAAYGSPIVCIEPSV